MGLYVRITNFIDGEAIFDFPALRIIKNNEGLEFTSKIHERITPHIKPNLAEKTFVKINHYGYNEALKLDKYKRNIEILKKYETKEKDSYYYFALGNEYSKINDYKNTLENYSKGISLSRGMVDLHYPLLCINFCKQFYKMKLYKECLSYIAIFKKSMKTLKILYFLESLCYLSVGDNGACKNSINNHKFILNEIYEYPTFYVDEKIRDMEKYLL